MKQCLWENDAGLLHRLDGPAYVDSDGYEAWYVNGKRHRVDGPAVIYQNGYQEWWVDDQRHRVDGPAVILSDGYQEWHINHKNITNEVLIWIKINNIPENYNEWTDRHRVLFRLRF